MDALLRQSPTAAYIAEHLGEDLFTLIDVGCGGGLMQGWRAIGGRLRAFGFDPQRYEVARLRAAETNPMVRYVEGYVGVAPDHPLAKMQQSEVYWSRSPWARLAPAASQAIDKGETPPDPTRILSIDETTPELDIPLNGKPRPLCPMVPEERRASTAADGALAIDEKEAAHQFDLRERNLWLDAELADPDRRIVLPDFLAEQGVTDIDFLKIDVDGPDYEILYTMSEPLNDAQVMGVSLEVNYDGSHHPHHHTFHNMDRFMRAHGFALFDLTVRTYSSSALPQPYVMPHAAQSIRGRPLQGDALYIRDFGQRVLGSEAEHVSAYKLAKTAMLFAMFDKPAEGVEHLLRFRDRLSPLFDVDHAIELLTTESQTLEWTHWNYADYMRAFMEGDPFFFNRLDAPEYDPETRTGAHPTTLAQDFARREQALYVAAKAETEKLKGELDRAKGELNRLKASRSWRWTAPMRRLLGSGPS